MTGTILGARARGARHRGIARLAAPGIGVSLLAAGCAHPPEAEQAPEPEPPVIVLDADSFLLYDGEPRRLREVFVLEIREPLVVRRIDGRPVERAAAFYHLLPGEYEVVVDYFVGEVDRAGRIAFDEDVVRWQLVTLRVTVSARAGEGGKLESEISGRSVVARVRRGKTVLVEASVLVY